MYFLKHMFSLLLLLISLTALSTVTLILETLYIKSLCFDCDTLNCPLVYPPPVTLILETL